MGKLLLNSSNIFVSYFIVNRKIQITKINNQRDRHQSQKNSKKYHLKSNQKTTLQIKGYLNINLKQRFKSQIMDIEQTSNAKQTQTLKNLITEILRNNTAYDCMSINSSICSINKNASLFDAINIIINQNIQELLVWDESLNRWIWMLTIVDAIRLIMHSLKTIIKEGKVNFRLFQEYREQGMHKFQSTRVQQFTKEQILMMIDVFQKKKIAQIILQINEPVNRLHHHHESLQHYNKFAQKQPGPNEPLYSSKKPPLPPSSQRPYIRLKSVVKQSKLSFVIMAMIVEKIHRILIQDTESKMIISILNFKDILLYLLRIANESHTDSYNSVTISSLLQAVNLKSNIEIDESRPLWQAFEAMTDLHRSLWINVVDRQRRFKGLLFRQDFRDIFKGWHIDYLWMSAGDFIKLKQRSHTSRIPEYRFFYPTDITKEIIWKIVMTKGNTIVWVDYHDGHKVKATIGLMQLFSLFVH